MQNNSISSNQQIISPQQSQQCFTFSSANKEISAPDWNELPVELFLKIFGYLSTKDLVSLKLTHKQFNLIIDPDLLLDKIRQSHLGISHLFYSKINNLISDMKVNNKHETIKEFNKINIENIINCFENNKETLGINKLWHTIHDIDNIYKILVNSSNLTTAYLPLGKIHTYKTNPKSAKSKQQYNEKSKEHIGTALKIYKSQTTLSSLTIDLPSVSGGTDKEQSPCNRIRRNFLKHFAKDFLNCFKVLKNVNFEGTYLEKNEFTQVISSLNSHPTLSEIELPTLFPKRDEEFNLNDLKSLKVQSLEKLTIKFYYLNMMSLSFANENIGELIARTFFT